MLPGVYLPHTVCPSFVYLNADKLQYFNSLSVGSASFAWRALCLWADNEARHKALIEGLAEPDSDEYRAGELGSLEKNMLLCTAPILLSSLLLIFRSFKETASLPFLASVFYLLSLWMGTIFQIVSPALCYFSPHNYLPFLSYEMLEVSFHCARHPRKAATHCPRSSRPLHPLDSQIVSLAM